MNYPSRSTLVLGLFAFTALGFSETSHVAPETQRIEPRIGKPGAVLKITGKSLDKAHVDEVFLTDHRFDMKVKVLEQADGHITIRIPPFAKPGRLQLLLLTAGSSPVYLEQPLYVQIEAGDDEGLPTPEVSQNPKFKPTVEVASTGTSVPVPVAGAPPPSPAVSPALEKSVTPLKVVATAQPAPDPAPPISQPVTPPPAPVQAQSKPVEQAQVKTPVQTIQSPAPPPTAAPAPKVQPADDTGNVAARIVQRAPVHFPPAAISQHVEGLVELIAVVRADGHVKDVKVLKGNPYLVPAAINSVRDWVYEPAYLHGKPIESEVTVLLNFKRPQ
jgi:outer membrane biosynthesis protein TonB